MPSRRRVTECFAVILRWVGGWGRSLRVTGLAATAAVCLAAALPAAATASNASSTKVFLHAARALAGSENAGVATGESSAGGYVNQVAGECPGILAHAPPGQGFSMLFGEAVEGLALAFSTPLHAAAVTFDRSIAHLRWSGKALTRGVRAIAAADRAEMAIAAPQACNDLRAWVAGGYSTIPQATESFFAAGEAAQKLPRPTQRGFLRKLARYESPRMKALARSTAALEGQTASALGPALEPLLTHLAGALGLELSTSAAPGTPRIIG